MRKNILSILVALVILTGCTKDDLAPVPATPAPTTPPVTPGTPPATTPIYTGMTTETTTGIFITTRDLPYTPGVPNTTLSCYNADLTLRWKKTMLGNVGVPNCFAENGKVYIQVSFFYQPNLSNPNNYVSYSNMYAFNAATGATLWSRLQMPELMQSGIVRNDTIFSTRALNGVNNIAAFSAFDGSLYWSKPNVDLYQPYQMYPDGKFLYYLGAGASTTSARYVCFNTGTQNEDWQIVQFSGFAGSVSQPVFTSSRLGMVIGSVAGSSLRTYNKSTGAVGFTKNANFGVPATSDDKFFIADQYQGIVALDDQSGASTWQTSMGGNTYVIGQPWLSGDNLYVIGQNYADGLFYIFSLKATTGVLSYKKNIRPVTGENVVVGSNIYSLNISNNTSTPKLMVFDAATGQAKDSVQLIGDQFGKLGVAGSTGKLYFSH